MPPRGRRGFCITLRGELWPLTVTQVVVAAPLGGDASKREEGFASPCKGNVSYTVVAFEENASEKEGFV